MGEIGDPLVVSTQFDLYLRESLGERRVGAAIFPSQGCVIAGCCSRLCVCWSRSRNRRTSFPPPRRKTAPVRFSPQQVQTPSFTAPKMVILFPILRRRGGKAPLGSQNIVSAHSPISIKSIQRDSSSELRHLGSSSARGQTFTTVFREASFRSSTTCRAIRPLAC